jgi:ABC-type multidrug transport system ATPase subunit
VLTQRFKKALTVEGEVNVNGEILSPTEMRKISVFVQQFDIFYGSMTVREYLVFCAQLRMGSQFTHDDKMAKVEEVITKVRCLHPILIT